MRRAGTGPGLPADPNDPVAIEAIERAHTNMLFNLVLALVREMSDSPGTRERALALLAHYEATVDDWDPFPVTYDGDGNPLPLDVPEHWLLLPLARREKIRAAVFQRMTHTMQALRHYAANPPELPGDAGER